MINVRVGDLVARRSYGFDVLFKVIDITRNFKKQKVALLKGVDLRIIADSPVMDLYRIPVNKIDDFHRSFDKKINNIIKKIMKERKENNIKQMQLKKALKGGTPFGRSGRVLHLDGDGEYLDECLKVYKQLDIHVVGKQIAESEQPKAMLELLKAYMPDILVITGHDGLLKGYEDFTKISHYRNSQYFIESVKQARKYEPSMDDLVIFAGGCQSHYEEILNAGANFASSPYRVLME
ncbi:sporulation peptidase YabG [Crassaminicella thermophila]|uniref:Sporulation peptidase YabG n=1 Tax=Crassaminicella thermophila TaxID=2599308 RepID=A0A5C0SK19_CRATE|nr:sporulation peptidase YabG [Crassaminicella thermophila]QEK13289.1 sporulation peptidase YabG [Crassaminicella thermophila]